jgi:hypothetical protein
MKLHKDILIQSGVSGDKPVMSGIYKFYETHGLPLDVIFSLFIEKGYVPDWIDLYKSAKNAGMKHDRIISKLEESISDSYGKEFCEKVISVLDSIFKK